MVKHFALAAFAFAMSGMTSPVSAATVLTGFTQFAFSLPLGAGGAIVTFEQDVSEATARTTGDAATNLASSLASPILTETLPGDGSVRVFRSEVGGATSGAGGAGSSNAFAKSSGVIRLFNPTADAVRVTLVYEGAADLATTITPEPGVSDFVAAIGIFSLFYEDLIDYEQSFVSSNGQPNAPIFAANLLVDLPSGAERVVRAAVSTEGIARSAPSVVPLPPAAALMVAGLAGLAIVGRRRAE
jgi:hypothetical protein